MIYRFRVTYEDHEDVYRDIDIKTTQSFSDFHFAIQQAIEFDYSKPASFYMSDDSWRKEKEILSTRGENTEKSVKVKTGARTKTKNKYQPLKVKTIADFVDNPHQKFIYVFDPDKEWTFLIELIKILPEEPSVTYPQCVKSIGKAPKQHKEANLPPPHIEEIKNESEELTHLAIEPLSDAGEDDDETFFSDKNEEEDDL